MAFKYIHISMSIYCIYGSIYLNVFTFVSLNYVCICMVSNHHQPTEIFFYVKWCERVSSNGFWLIFWTHAIDVNMSEKLWNGGIKLLKADACKWAPNINSKITLFRFTVAKSNNGTSRFWAISKQALNAANLASQMRGLVLKTLTNLFFYFFSRQKLHECP